MKRKHRRKFFRAAATALAAAAVVSLAFVSCGTKCPAPQCAEAEKRRVEWSGIEEYEVGAFDTLSGIAVKYIPSDDCMEQWIEDVMRLNCRRNTTIYYGETIKVYNY